MCACVCIHYIFGIVYSWYMVYGIYTVYGRAFRCTAGFFIKMRMRTPVVYIRVHTAAAAAASLWQTSSFKC